MADDLVKRLRDWPVTGITTHEAADRIGQLEQRLEATKDKAEAAILDLMAERDRAEARLDKAMVALREIAAEASVTVKVAQGDGIHWKGMYKDWRKIATTRIDIARAVLAEIEGGKKDD